MLKNNDLKKYLPKKHSKDKGFTYIYKNEY